MTAAEEARNAKGLTREQVAKTLSRAPGTIANAERYGCPEYLARRLSMLYGCPMEFFSKRAKTANTVNPQKPKVPSRRQPKRD